MEETLQLLLLTHCLRSFSRVSVVAVFLFVCAVQRVVYSAGFRISCVCVCVFHLTLLVWELRCCTGVAFSEWSVAILTQLAIALPVFPFVQGR